MSGPIIDLGDVARKASEDQFWALRGHAIQAYASLEQSLCRLLAYLGAMSGEVAALIFFRITSTQARNTILEKLFRYKFGDKFNLFRNSLISQLRPIDTERNEIVHWNTVNNVGVGEGGLSTISVTLRPPAFIYNINNSPEKTVDDLIEFMQKCSFYERLLNMFIPTTDDSYDMPGFDKIPWLSIFSQPIVYPPLAGHPLLQT